MVALSNRKKDHEMHLYVILPTECAQAAVLMLYCMKTRLLSHLFGVDTHHFEGDSNVIPRRYFDLLYSAIDSITAAAARFQSEASIRRVRLLQQQRGTEEPSSFFQWSY